MKFLKKLTKVVSVVLAAVSVFSVGIPASALKKVDDLKDKEAIIRTATARYELEQLRDGRIIFRNAEGKVVYGICWNPAISRYCFVNIKTGECECSMSEGGCATFCYASDSNKVLAIFSRPSSRKLLWNICECLRPGQVGFKKMESVGRTGCDSEGTLVYGGKALARIYSRGFTEKNARITMFLAIMSSAVNYLG